MNYCVPEFDMGDDYPIPSSSGAPPSSSHPKGPSSTADEDIMELLWHNGQLVMQNQSQRLPKRSSSHVEQTSSQQQQEQQQLFMQEDEMSSWLHYPLVEHSSSSSFDHNFCADLLYPPPPSSTSKATTFTTTTTVPVRTTHVSISEPKPPPKKSSESSPGVVDVVGVGEGGIGGSFSKQSMPPPSLISRPRTGSGSEPSVQNFGLFSRYMTRAQGAEETSSSKSAALPRNTFVDSNDTPSTEVEAAKQRSVEGGGKNIVSGFVGTGGSWCAGGERSVWCNTTTAGSSPHGSCASGEQQQGKKKKKLQQQQQQPPPPPVEDRKRKGREVEEAEGQTEDIEFELADTKKQVRGSTSSKRSRAAEVHNLSERRRRDRINEKMRALQELIPRCNKSDKASMLDEAIEYLKSLQLQVQMMSMGYGMVPMMYPGIQQYMPPMGMGLGMGMNMEMAMNRPMMPYPNMLPSSAFPTSGASAHMDPRYSMPPSPFQMPPTHTQDPALNTVGAPNQIPPRLPLYTDAYQQYFGLPQMQLPLPQNQVMAAPNTSRPGSGGRTDNVDNPKSG